MCAPEKDGDDTMRTGESFDDVTNPRLQRRTLALIPFMDENSRHPLPDLIEDSLGRLGTSIVHDDDMDKPCLFQLADKCEKRLIRIIGRNHDDILI